MPTGPPSPISAFRDRRLVKTTAVFALAGPVVGYLTLMTVQSFVTAASGAELVWTLLGALALIPIGTFFAFLIGAVPAALTGALVAVMDGLNHSGRYRTPKAMLVGVLVTLAVQLFRSPALRLEDLAIFLPLAAISAAVCARLTQRWATPAA